MPYGTSWKIIWLKIAVFLLPSSNPLLIQWLYINFYTTWVSSWVSSLWLYLLLPASPAAIPSSDIRESLIGNHRPGETQAWNQPGWPSGGAQAWRSPGHDKGASSGACCLGLRLLRLIMATNRVPFRGMYGISTENATHSPMVLIISWFFDALQIDKTGERTNYQWGIEFLIMIYLKKLLWVNAFFNNF